MSKEAGTPFRFPAGVGVEDAMERLRQAYASIPEGKLLRRVLKEQRRQGLDPPSDVQYVARPHVVDEGGRCEVELDADILIYEEFEQMGECLSVFERVLSDELGQRLSASR